MEWKGKCMLSEESEIQRENNFVVFAGNQGDA